MRRYTLISEPAAHLEARREVVVEARNDGEAYDQAADHVAAEVPYHCTLDRENRGHRGWGTSSDEDKPTGGWQDRYLYPAALSGRHIWSSIQLSSARYRRSSGLL